MAIPCPGVDRFSQNFAAARTGPNPFIAFVRALIVLVLDIARSQSLRRFLTQDCEKECEKIITGPDFNRFIVRLSPLRGGGWSCLISVDVEARIDCVLTVEVREEDEHSMRELQSYLQSEEQATK